MHHLTLFNYFYIEKKVKGEKGSIVSLSVSDNYFRNNICFSYLESDPVRFNLAKHALIAK